VNTGGVHAISEILAIDIFLTMGNPPIDLLITPSLLLLTTGSVTVFILFIAELGVSNLNRATDVKNWKTGQRLQPGIVILVEAAVHHECQALGQTLRTANNSMPALDSGVFGRTVRREHTVVAALTLLTGTRSATNSLFFCFSYCSPTRFMCHDSPSWIFCTSTTELSTKFGLPGYSYWM